MKYQFLAVVFSLFLSSFASNSPRAQDQGSVRGQLGGTVFDSTQAVVSGASVSVTGATGSAQRKSNEQGEFFFPGLIPGFYDVKVSKDGFKATTIHKVEVLVNKTAEIKVAMELGAVTQNIEVVATAVSVESQSTAVTSDIPDTVYDNLPLARSITSVFYVSPGVASGLGTGTQNPAISGATGLENAYYADGVLLNDAAFGGLGVYQRRYGGLGVGINSSFVKEVQVITAAFGPQYGHSTGGVIVMVTKSGSNQFHGVVGGYFQSRGMSAAYENQDDFQTTNKIGKEIAPQAYEGDFELGGHVPLGALKNRLFFFGAFNPTWNANFVQPVPGTGLFAETGGTIDRKDTVWDYAAKVTYQINSNHQIEAAVFGDPTHSNLAAWQTLNINNFTADTSQNFGSKGLTARYNGTIGSSLVLDVAFTMDWNRFSENPLPVTSITDETQTAGLPGQVGFFNAQGYGSFESYNSNQKGIQLDVHKVVTILGRQHTISLGYNWTFPTYNDTNGFSGPSYPIATNNVSRTPYFSPAQIPYVTGQFAEFHLLLELLSNVPGSPSCSLCPYMNVSGYASPQQVVLVGDSGPYSAFTSVNTAKNHAAYVNDEWEMSKYATLSLGLRWEQQRMSSGGVSQVLNDQWDPRIGFSLDPKGDRKSKIYVNFGRYAWIMPLDAAIRELTNQNEVSGIYFAPDTPDCNTGHCVTQSTPTNVSPNDLVTLDQYGTATFDSRNILNNATGGIRINPNVSIVSGSGSSPFAPGTRMEYNDEFVVGAEHEFRGGITGSVRYIDRRVKRIIEDFTGVSIEQSLAGIPGTYFIGNPNKNTDVTVNPNPIVFSQGALFTPGAAGANGQPTGYPAGCYDSNGNITPYIDLNVQNSIQVAQGTGATLGSVCYPSVNDNSWTTFNGKCTAGSPPNCPSGQTPLSITTGALFGGEAQPDGQPDGYLSPVRNYQAVEIEINKQFSHNWSLISNWRISRLIGNFEGAYRNDNGQNDPGISSLWDFTPGVLGTLADQFAPGPLNSDRLHIVNIYPTYVFDKGWAKGLTITPGVKIQTGVPLTTLTAQEAYLDPGEVPQFGRGDLGRAPVTGTIDVHVDYPWRISERKSMHFAIDMLNIADTRRNLLVNKNYDVEFGAKNVDFNKPGTSFGDAAGTQLVQGFVQPFSARFHLSFNF
jgi:hypothetical protein